MMKNKFILNRLTWVLTVFAAVMVMIVGVKGFRSTQQGSMTLAYPAQAAPVESSVAQVAGSYAGVVELQGTVVGVYSDTLPTLPITGTPDLGTIDLSLSISQSGNALTGYVALDKTLVFSVEHIIQSGGASLEIGPTINGNFDGTNLIITSERVSIQLGTQLIQRQFRLTGAISQSDGSQVTGQYRETLWGAARQPVTVIGSFTLQRPVFDNTAPDTTNKIPNLIEDAAVTGQAVAVTINVLSNDSDANGDTLTVTSVSKPQFGTASTNGQSVTYTPNPTFVGTDSFSYFVSDGKGGTAAGSVMVTVNGANGPNQSPTASNDTIVTTPGSAVIIDVLLNDADPNGDTLLISIDGQPANGTAIVENGKIVYTPKAGFSGTDTFTYIVSDGKGGSASASVTVTVTTNGQPSGTSIYLPVIQR